LSTQPACQLDRWQAGFFMKAEPFEPLRDSNKLSKLSNPIKLSPFAPIY
jgi:hypothetical protein